jgi:hypothetical protein
MTKHTTLAAGLLTSIVDPTGEPQLKAIKKLFIANVEMKNDMM